MAHLPLRKPKYGHVDAVCPVCRVDTFGADLVYDPRKPKRSRAVVCRWCGGWLAGYRPAWSGQPGGRTRYMQDTFPSLINENPGETDSPATQQKAKR